VTQPAIVAIAPGTPVPSEVRDRVSALDAAAAAQDGTPALDDQVRLDLASASPSVTHLLGRWPGGGDDIVAYAHADRRADDIVSGHLVVAPSHRRHGVGSALLEALGETARPGALRVWAHGNTASAQAFAARHGFGSVRELRKMRRRLDVAIPAPSYHPGVSVRTFVVGHDEAAWVAVNAAAFAHHPEQGRLTVDDLRQRIAQPWFDPSGFFLAERDGALVGYHWTKVHAAGGRSGGPVGEVYVLGVDPQAQGLGLGKALTLTGLRHLRDLGLDEVVLYVDGDNLPAVAVYERLGFETASADVMYARSSPRN
jgi:mycothiol synthase